MTTSSIHRPFGVANVAPLSSSEQSRLGIAATLFLLAHIPLALAFAQVSALVAIHAVGTVLVVLFWALSDPTPVRVERGCMYIIASEVLWRMLRAPVFWEYGKYSIILIMFIAAVRFRERPRSAAPLLYLLVLIPSMALLLSEPDEARVRLSVNMSGPVALAIAAYYFTGRLVPSEQRLRMMAYGIAPTITISSIILLNLSQREIDFINNSNAEVTGGFGPNQVSAALALGAVLAFLCAVTIQRNRPAQVAFIGLVLLFGAHSALTFSRAGLYITVACLVLASLCLARDRSARVRLVFLPALLVAGAYWIALPAVNNYTKGRVFERFQDTRSSNRDKLAIADLTIWRENPLFGVGPGGADERRGELIGATFDIVTHTEFTRLLCEHGFFGLVALFLLIGMGLKAYRVALDPVPKGVVVAFLAWTCLYMIVNGMRTAAPAFLFGMALAIPTGATRVPIPGGWPRGRQSSLRPGVRFAPPEVSAGRSNAS